RVRHPGHRTAGVPTRRTRPEALAQGQKRPTPSSERDVGPEAAGGGPEAAGGRPDGTSSSDALPFLATMAGVAEGVVLTAPTGAYRDQETVGHDGAPVAMQLHRRLDEHGTARHDGDPARFPVPTGRSGRFGRHG